MKPVFFFGALLMSMAAAHAGTFFECSGAATALTKPVRKGTKANVKLHIDSVVCSADSGDAPKPGSTQAVVLESARLGLKDRVYFKVSWKCDQKCGEKTWQQTPSLVNVKKSN